jgi:DNA-binding HxlR family transcriptional regulator
MPKELYPNRISHGASVRDITASRHRGNPESVAAHDVIQNWKEFDRSILMDYLRRRGPKTSKELSNGTGIKYTSVSARLSELKADGWVVKTGLRREGAAEVRAVTQEERNAAKNLQLPLALRAQAS